MTHLAATEMFLFSFEFPALEVPRLKFKEAAISKYFFLFRTLSYIYNPDITYMFLLG